MQIDPRYMEFTEIMDLGVETEAEIERFAELVKEGKVVAVADHAEQLRQLQDDLRRVGYRKMR